jgi:pilus assembly protein CpaB
MRRTATLGVALVLAILGTILLVAYVRGAEQRALQGQEMASVYVVSTPVERGASLDTVRESVTLTEIPRFAVPEGAVSDLQTLAGLVPTADLHVGEQLLALRFATPEILDTEARVDVPPEFLQLTIELSADRAIGGQLITGDLVAVIASFEPFSLGGFEPGEDPDPEIPLIPVDPTLEEDEQPLVLQTPHATRVLLNKVLVTGVQFQDPETTGSAAVSPTGSILVTLAATAEETERIVFAMEYGTVWLARQDPDAQEPETAVRTRANIYR